MIAVLTMVAIPIGDIAMIGPSGTNYSHFFMLRHIICLIGRYLLTRYLLKKVVMSNMIHVN